MGVVAGLLLGAGLCLLLWAWTSPFTTTSGPASRWASHLEDLLVQAGAPGVSPAGLVGACLTTGSLAASLVLAGTRAPYIAMCFGAMAAYAPLAVVRMRARRRRHSLRSVWPEVVDHLSSGIRAGLSLPEALSQLADRGPVELRPAFRAFAEDHRADGRFSDCLDRLKARLADPVADRLVEALRITRDVGGTDLGRLLRTLAAFLREDARTRGELEARQSWTVNAARLAVAAPWLVLAMLASRPEAAAAYSTAAGGIVLLAGGMSTVVAYQLMVRISRLPDDVRVLR